MNKDDLQAIKDLFKNELEPLKLQLNESMQVLNSLNHNVEKGNLEYNKTFNEIVYMQEKIENLVETNKLLLKILYVTVSDSHAVN